MPVRNQKRESGSLSSRPPFFPDSLRTESWSQCVYVMWFTRRSWNTGGETTFSLNCKRTRKGSLRSDSLSLLAQELRFEFEVKITVLRTRNAFWKTQRQGTAGRNDITLYPHLVKAITYLVAHLLFSISASRSLFFSSPGSAIRFRFSKSRNRENLSFKRKDWKERLPVYSCVRRRKRRQEGSFGIRIQINIIYVFPLSLSPWAGRRSVGWSINGSSFTNSCFVSIDSRLLMCWVRLCLCTPLSLSLSLLPHASFCPVCPSLQPLTHASLALLAPISSIPPSSLVEEFNGLSVHLIRRRM